VRVEKESTGALPLPLAPPVIVEAIEHIPNMFIAHNVPPPGTYETFRADNLLVEEVIMHFGRADET